MKARRYPVRQVDSGDRCLLEGLRVKDHEVGGLVSRVDDEADEPAFVLLRVGARRHEHELAWQVPVAELVHAPAARFEVVLVQPRGASELRVAPSGGTETV